MKKVNLSFYALILSVLIVSLLAVALLYKISPLFASKPLFYCQKFTSNIMFEIPKLLPNLFILSTGIILGIGLLSLLLQLGKTRLMLKRLLVNKKNPTKNLETIIRSLGLTGRVILIRSNSPFSFCSGFFSPFIVVSTALTLSLEDKEIEAVLLHEQSHLVNKDPIKMLIGKIFSSMFFFLPLFRDLHKNIEAVNELLADQWAINYQKKSTFLRGALKKILAEPQLNFATISKLAGPDFFEIRVHRLVNPGITHKLRLSWISIITTFIFILVSWFLLKTPVSALHTASQPNSNYLLCSEHQSCLRD